MLALWLNTFFSKAGTSCFFCGWAGLQRNGLPSSQNSPVLLDPPLLPVLLSCLYFLPGYWPISIYLKYNWQNTDHGPTSHNLKFNTKLLIESWRDGSAVKSTVCSFRGPGSDSQHWHGNIQPYITPIVGELHHPPISVGTRHTCSFHIYMQALTHIHILFSKIKIKASFKNCLVCSVILFLPLQY